MIIDGSYDLRQKYNQTYYISNTEESKKDFIENVIPQWIDYFERLKNKSNSKWFVGKRVSIADIAVFDVLNDIEEKSGLIMKNSTLKKFMIDFKSQPKYEEYVKSNRYHLR